MDNVDQLARIATALSDPLRLRILFLFAKGRDASCQSPVYPPLPHALCPYLDIQPKLENITASKLSYHLRGLREAGILQEHREGKLVYYDLNEETITHFLENMRHFYLTPQHS